MSWLCNQGSKFMLKTEEKCWTQIFYSSSYTSLLAVLLEPYTTLLAVLPVMVSERCTENQPRLARTFRYGTSILHSWELAEGHLHSALALPASNIGTLAGKAEVTGTLLGVKGAMLLILYKAAEVETITVLTFASKNTMEDSSELKIPSSTIYKTKRRSMASVLCCWGT